MATPELHDRDIEHIAQPEGLLVEILLIDACDPLLHLFKGRVNFPDESGDLVRHLGWRTIRPRVDDADEVMAAF